MISFFAYRAALVSICLCVGLWFPAIANSETSIVILPLESEASIDVTRDLETRLKNLIGQQLRMRVRANVDFSLDEARVTFDCDDENARCMAETGRMFRTPLLIWGSLRGYGPYVLTLNGLDVKTERIKYSSTVQFETTRDLEMAMDDVVDAFINGVDFRAPNRLTLITSEPANAEVFLDDELIGQTPLSHSLVNREGGRLVVKMKRYKTQTQVIQNGAGNTPLHFELSRAPIYQSDDPNDVHSDTGTSKRSWPILLTITGGVIGAAGLGFGSYYGLENRRLDEEMQTNIASNAPSGQKRAIDQSLRQEFERSQLMANVTFGIGAAALIAGAYGLYEYLKGPEKTVRLEGDRVFFEVQF